MILTIFRSRIKPEAEQEYNHWAERMAQLAAEMPGYISHKGFAARDGERLTFIEFENEETLQKWARHPDHVEAKKKGRADFYLEYRILICTVLRESTFPARLAKELQKVAT
jgi:heme-degrading monooxygenase HmoA